MEDRKEKDVGWLSVPQFGDWDQKGGKVPDYSKIRESRMQHRHLKGQSWKRRRTHRWSEQGRSSSSNN